MLRYGLQSRTPHRRCRNAGRTAACAAVLATGSMQASSRRGHHGSRTSSHGFLLEMVQPEKIVVSNALRNRYNHPHPDAVGRMLTHVPPERLHFTALDGAVIYRLDGQEVRRVKWRE